MAILMVIGFGADSKLRARGNQNVRRLRTCYIDLLDAKISAKSLFSLTKI